MEEFKDVMLSEPPAGRGYGDASGQNRSFENFKGILLCDRPSDHRMVVGVAEQPFLPPGRPDRDLFGMPGQETEGSGCLGLQPSQETANRHNVARQARMENSRNVAPTALSKHRKWLRSLTEETRKLKLDAIETQLVSEEKQKRFQDVERKKRVAIRADRAVNDLSGPRCGKVLRGNKPDPNALVEDSPPPSLPPDVEEDLPEALPADEYLPADAVDGAEDSMPPSAERAAAAVADAASGGGRRKKKGKEKPKWAMTQAQAQDADEDAFEEEMHEAQGLLDFAMNLDYDKFIEDYEVREALSIMRERVEEIAEEQGMEPGQLRREDGPASTRRRAADECSVATSQCSDRTAALERKRAREARQQREAHDRQQVADKDWDSSSVVGDKARRVIGDDALRLAERILAKSDALRQVHSKQSLGKVLQDIVVNKNIPLGGKPKTVPPAPAMEEPVVADIRAADRGGSPQKERRILTDLRKSKEYVQNLPYLYRCPSI